MAINIVKFVKNYRVWFATAILSAAIFVFGGSAAEAKITVEGNRAFTDEVNNCLITYKGAPGMLADVINELEKSKNEHKIVSSPDWNNTPNNADAAMGGAGCGTVTKVDKAELEVYKSKFPELANKDYCSALLHELWHAVDADRGEWTWTKEKLDGVNKDEIEATTFQNFVHAIRGVDPRVAYGGTDIAKHVLAPGEAVPTPTPTPAEPAAPSVSTSFSHVKPGEYSEIYAIVKTTPGASVSIKLTGPGVAGKADQSETADTSGVAKFAWKIVSYGSYAVNGTANAGEFNSTVNVQ